MKCRLCQQSDLETFIAKEKFPIYIWPIDRNYQQEYEKLNVHRCLNCGLVQLDVFEDAFVEKLYSKEVFGLTGATEFPVTTSKNNRFLEYCSKVLGNNWSEGKAILDIGGYDILAAFDVKCSKGVICDPNGPDKSPRENISICKKFFSADWFGQQEFDVVIAKHTVEHINDLQRFMEDIRFVLKDSGVIILEVPELSQGLAQGYYTLFYHQHLMYFDRFSLKNVLTQFGFEVADVTVAGGNLRMIARKLPRSVEKPVYEKDLSIPEQFNNYRQKLDDHLQRIGDLLKKVSQDKKCICYGAGGGTTILFHLNPAIQKFISHVVDSSRSKIGKMIGGTPYVVQSPEILKDLFDCTILINSLEYYDEIYQDLVKKYDEHDFSYLKIIPTIEVSGKVKELI